MKNWDNNRLTFFDQREAPKYTQEETYKSTRLPVDQATTLLSDAYRSSTFFQIEQERMFRSGWVCVGYTSQVATPGDTFLTTVASQPLIITRDKLNVIHAFYNVCRHRGSRLVTKDDCYKVFRCPYHAWGYGLNGELLGTPYFEGLDVSQAEKEAYASQAKEFNKKDYPLLSAKVDCWGCFIFVNLDEKPTFSLREWLGDLPERLKRYPLDELALVARKHYTLEANWKIVAENFTEYYHLPWVHPELVKVSRIENHYRYQGPGMYTGFCTSPLTQDPKTVDLQLEPYEMLSETEKKSAFFFLVFPNLCLFVLPDHVFTLLFQPVGPMCTQESGDMLVHSSVLQNPEAKQKIDGIHSFWHEVNIEDKEAVELVQEGMNVNAYTGGRMCFKFEEPVHRFQNMVVDRMLGVDRIPPGDTNEPSQMRVAT